ncbi:MAG: LuxR family transcriptional regulator, partial [Microbacterium sp.]
MGSTDDLLRQVRNACAEQLPAKALQVRILDLLRPHVGYDGHVFPLTDPVTLVSAAPHADVPMLPWERLPELIRWRYLSTVNRVDALTGRPAASLRLSDAGPTASPAWVHVLQEIGVHDTANVVFADRYGTWGYLELLRTGHRFEQSELDVLTALAATATASRRPVVARTFVDPGEQLVPVGPAVVLLGADLDVEQQTEAAAAALLQLLPPDELRAPIPAAAYNVGAALIAAESGVPLGEPWSRVHLGGGRWVTVKASRLGAGIAI